jgi:hypothetical protein
VPEHHRNRLVVKVAPLGPELPLVEIWLALRPSVQSLVSSSIRSLVQVMPAPALAVLIAGPSLLTGEHRPAPVETLGAEGKVAPR